MTDTALAALRSLTKLRTLDLARTKITDEGLFAEVAVRQRSLRATEVGLTE